MSSHTPVLLNEVLEYLNPRAGDFIIDGTIDGGGHATAIMKKVLPGGMLLGVDWDEKMIARRKPHIVDSKKEILVHGNYADLPGILKKEKLGKADGLLLDLGFSSEQLAAAGRGFSFGDDTKDEPLLMTYDDSEKPVAELLRELSETDLADIIFTFGGERSSRRIAKAIKERGRKKSIVTSGELVDVIRGALPQHYERGRIHPATRTFQALRIYANGELENIKRALLNVEHIVKKEGRIVIITFHSLEDRIVKQAFQKLTKDSKAILLTKKPVAPTYAEIKENPRSRSAKLRAIELAASL